MINAAMDDVNRINNKNAFTETPSQFIQSDVVFMQEIGAVSKNDKDPLLYRERLTPMPNINAAMDNVNRISNTNAFTKNIGKGQVIHGPTGVDSASNVTNLPGYSYIISYD